MARPKIEFRKYSDAILLQLHKLVANDWFEKLTAEDLAASLHIPQRISDLTIADLLESGLCEVTQGRDAIGNNIQYIEITRVGIELVEEWSDDDYDKVAKYIEDRNKIKEPDNQEVPASDRVVSIDHNSDDYKEAIGALEEFEKKAKVNNEFRGLFTDPDDGDRILSEVRMGRELLQQARASVQAAKELLLRNLKWVAEQLPGTAINTLASKAFDAIIKLFSGT